MIEEQRPDISFIARAELSKTSKIVLSEEFAKRVNALAGAMPDSEELATLFAPWDSMVSHIANKEKRQYQLPTSEWVDLMENIEHQEYVQLKRLVRHAYTSHDLRTVGDFRDFTSGGTRYSWRIGPRGRAFGFLAFKKSEAETLPLGLLLPE